MHLSPTGASAPGLRQRELRETLSWQQLEQSGIPAGVSILPFLSARHLLFFRLVNRYRYVCRQSGHLAVISSWLTLRHSDWRASASRNQICELELTRFERLSAHLRT